MTFARKGEDLKVRKRKISRYRVPLTFVYWVLRGLVVHKQVLTLLTVENKHNPAHKRKGNMVQGINNDYRDGQKYDSQDQ